MAKRRSSLHVSLVLIGATTLAGCADKEVPARDVYARLEDCQADWDRAENCEPVPQDDKEFHNRYPAGGYYYGPRYYAPAWSSGRLRPSPHALDAAPVGRSSTGSGNTVSRGGFGSSSQFHSAGG